MKEVPRFVLTIALPGSLLISSGVCSSQNPRSTRPQALLGQFEAAWEMVAEGHYDTTFGGQDWQAIHDLYRQLVTEACCDAEFYELVNRMLFTLEHSHLGIVPPGTWPEMEPTTFAVAGIGVDVRLFDADVLLTRVVAGSPAHRAGLRTGWRLISIDGRPTQDIVNDRLGLLEPPFNSQSSATNGIEAMLYGPAGTCVRLVAVGPTDQRVELCVAREVRRKTIELDRSFPPFRLELEAKTLKNGVGYVRFNTFAPVLGAEVLAAIDSFRAAPALIIDLRGNPGGVRAVADRLAARLLARPALIGAVETRTGRHEVRLEPDQSPYTGRVVVLVDEMTRSAGEYFAGCLQSIGRVTVVGTRTPGSVGPALRTTAFDNGAVLVGPVGRTTTADGTVLEGRGVIPDLEVSLDRSFLIQGRDSQLESAIGLIAFRED